MGAGDWASRTIDELQDEFEVNNARAVRITNLVRQIVSDPDFKELRDAGLVDEEFTRVFAENTVKSLKKREGDSIEKRWNNLVQSFGLADVAGEAVYLEPWNDTSQSPTQRSNTSPSSSDSTNQQRLSSWEDDKE